MYRFTNVLLKDRRGRSLKSVGDWDHPDEKGNVPPVKEPSLRQALLHFVEFLPQVVTDPQGRCGLPLQDLIARERIAEALSHDGPEPEIVELEDEHRNRLMKWFEALGPKVFGADAVPVNAEIEKGKLGKAGHGNARSGDRDEIAAAGGGQNGDRRLAGARNGND